MTAAELQAWLEEHAIGWHVAGGSWPHRRSTRGRRLDSRHLPTCGRASRARGSRKEVAEQFDRVTAWNLHRVRGEDATRPRTKAWSEDARLP